MVSQLLCSTFMLTRISNLIARRVLVVRLTLSSWSWDSLSDYDFLKVCKTGLITITFKQWKIKIGFWKEENNGKEN